MSAGPGAGAPVVETPPASLQLNARGRNTADVDHDHALGEAATRGSLHIADRVVERVAGYAVTQVDDAAAAPRRVLGVNVGEARPDEQAAVAARVHGDEATVQATIAVAWPASVRSVCDAVRRRVRDDVGFITGVHVQHVDLDVVSMSVPTAPRPRVQ